MAPLPPEVLHVIESTEGEWTSKAFADALRLDLDWADVIHCARTSNFWKREHDEHHDAVDGWKDTITGHDRRGRPMYLTGKKMYFEGVTFWKVVTFHEDTERTRRKAGKRRRST